MAALALCVPFAAAACGGSSTPKSTDAFCTRLADLRATDPISDAATDNQAADQAAKILDGLIDTAPQQIKGDLRTFRRLIDDVRDVDKSDPAATQAAVQKLVTADVISAGQSLASFAKSECGFDDVFSTSGDDGSS